MKSTPALRWAVVIVLVLPFAQAFAAGQMVSRQLIASGLETPTNLAHLEDGRILVLEPYLGHVRVIDDGVLLDEPFLSIQDRMEEDPHVEGGLLGLAFPPDFRQSKDVYLTYTDVRGDLVLSRFAASADGRHARADSEVVLLKVADGNYGWHNCGHIAFAADGRLYFCVGDMDVLPNPTGSAQNLDTLMGKILRLDPAAAPVEPEVIAYGLKNPWRFTLMTSGSLIIPDVGYETWEELSLLRPDAQTPANLGWNLAEGNDCRETRCEAELVWPLYVYPHDGSSCAIIGGAVYRGKDPAWHGVYVFGDFCSGALWAIRAIETAPEITQISDDFVQIGTVGVDAAGEIIVSDFGEGAVYRLQLPPADELDWQGVPELVQRQSLQGRRTGFHSIKTDMEKFYSSRRWAVMSGLFELYDRTLGKVLR